MLCQTQVSRVIVYYNNRLRLFPTVQDLSQASVSEVLAAWSGLGYNSRGMRVNESAKMIVNQWSFPTTYKELLTLPGVGDYVANAILAFAHNEDVAVIDTNIRRILIHRFQLDEKISLQELKKIALEVLPGWYARDRYNALMDYGALEVTAKKTGIRPLTRQSKFEGSRRQVRAWIIKEIINSVWGSITLEDITKRFPDRDDNRSIIDDLLKENIIKNKDGELTIKN